MKIFIYLETGGLSVRKIGFSALVFIYGLQQSFYVYFYSNSYAYKFFTGLNYILKIQ